MVCATLLTACEDSRSAQGESGGAGPSADASPSGSARGLSVETGEDLPTAQDGTRGYQGPGSAADALRDRWEYSGLPGDPPVVDVVRVVTSAEYNEIWPGCMEEQGFPTSTDQFGQPWIKFEREHEADVELASYICEAKYPMEQKYYDPYTDEQLRTLYDWRVGTNMPCLRSHGLEPSDPPSFESFVAEYRSTGYKTWSPKTAPELVVPPEKRDIVDEECPDTPPEEILYPSS